MNLTLEHHKSSGILLTSRQATNLPQPVCNDYKTSNRDTFQTSPTVSCNCLMSNPVEHEEEMSVTDDQTIIHSQQDITFLYKLIISQMLTEGSFLPYTPNCYQGTIFWVRFGTCKVSDTYCYVEVDGKRICFKIWAMYQK